MERYNTTEDIQKGLKRLNLERKIALEEMKGLKYDLKEDLSPFNWMNSMISAVKKYGVLYLIKKIIK